MTRAHNADGLTDEERAERAAMLAHQEEMRTELGRLQIISLPHFFLADNRTDAERVADLQRLVDEAHEDERARYEPSVDSLTEFQVWLVLGLIGLFASLSVLIGVVIGINLSRDWAFTRALTW